VTAIVDKYSNRANKCSADITPQIDAPPTLEKYNFSVERTEEWGLIISPDGTTLYVSPSGDIWEYAE
jgi:hypothetical protein